MADRQTAEFKAPSADDPILQEIVRRLVGLYAPVRIYLFGSAARGEAGPDSDYDIMVVVPDGTPPEVRNRKDMYEALRGINVPIDVLVWTQTDFFGRLHLKVSFPTTVVEEGKLLYAA